MSFRLTPPVPNITVSSDPSPPPPAPNIFLPPLPPLPPYHPRPTRSADRLNPYPLYPLYSSKPAQLQPLTATSTTSSSATVTSSSGLSALNPAGLAISLSVRAKSLVSGRRATLSSRQHAPVVSTSQSYSTSPPTASSMLQPAIVLTGSSSVHPGPGPKRPMLARLFRSKHHSKTASSASAGPSSGFSPESRGWATIFDSRPGTGPPSLSFSGASTSRGPTSHVPMSSSVSCASASSASLFSASSRMVMDDGPVLATGRPFHRSPLPSQAFFVPISDMAMAIDPREGSTLGPGTGISIFDPPEWHEKKMKNKTARPETFDQVEAAELIEPAELVDTTGTNTKTSSISTVSTVATSKSRTTSSSSSATSSSTSSSDPASPPPQQLPHPTSFTPYKPGACPPTVIVDPDDADCSSDQPSHLIPYVRLSGSFVDEVFGSAFALDDNPALSLPFDFSICTDQPDDTLDFSTLSPSTIARISQCVRTRIPTETPVKTEPRSLNIPLSYRPAGSHTRTRTHLDVTANHDARSRLDFGLPRKARSSIELFSSYVSSPAMFCSTSCPSPPDNVADRLGSRHPSLPVDPITPTKPAVDSSVEEAVHDMTVVSTEVTKPSSSLDSPPGGVEPPLGRRKEEPPRRLERSYQAIRPPQQPQNSHLAAPTVSKPRIPTMAPFPRISLSFVDLAIAYSQTHPSSSPSNRRTGKRKARIGPACTKTPTPTTSPVRPGDGPRSSRSSSSGSSGSNPIPTGLRTRTVQNHPVRPPTTSTSSQSGSAALAAIADLVPRQDAPTRQSDPNRHMYRPLNFVNHSRKPRSTNTLYKSDPAESRVGLRPIGRTDSTSESAIRAARRNGRIHVQV